MLIIHRRSRGGRAAPVLLPAAQTLHRPPPPQSTSQPPSALRCPGAPLPKSANLPLTECSSAYSELKLLLLRLRPLPNITDQRPAWVWIPYRRLFHPKPGKLKRLKLQKCLSTLTEEIQTWMRRHIPAVKINLGLKRCDILEFMCFKWIAFLYVYPCVLRKFRDERNERFLHKQVSHVTF